MTALGVRYVAVVGHPQRADWEPYPAPALYKTEADARLVVADTRGRVCGCDYQHAVSLLRLDLDNLTIERVTDDPSLTYEDDERLLLHYTAREAAGRAAAKAKLGEEARWDPPQSIDVTLGATDHVALRELRSTIARLDLPLTTELEWRCLNILDKLLGDKVERRTRHEPCSGCSSSCNCECGGNYCGCPCHSGGK